MSKIFNKTLGSVGVKQPENPTLKPVTGVKGLAAGGGGGLAAGNASKRLSLKGFGKLSK
jgi:formyltetrahydrofolate synthetase